MALVHYPVVNKSGDTIASAVTNLDLHDISRAAKTYGVKRFFVVTPLTDQQVLVDRIIAHWTAGAGGVYNPKRQAALELACLTASLDDAVAHITEAEGDAPRTVATCARVCNSSIEYAALREKLKTGKPYLLVFGTAWGLSEQVLEEADLILKPVAGRSNYNHLSVRSAASIIMDRLLGSDS